MLFHRVASQSLKLVSSTSSAHFLFKKSARCCCTTTQLLLPFVGKKAPEFECLALMPNGKEKTLTLKDYRGKYVVLFFYPLDFTFVCPTEITAFSDCFEQFKDLNCEVFAASCDSYFSHLEWTKKDRKSGGIGKVAIPLLADKSMQVAKMYNVLNETKGFPHRGLFVIDDKGILRHMSVNDTGVGRNVDEIIRIVQAFQYSDKHGEVCPINWRPGCKTIDPHQADDYFSSPNN